MRRFARRSFGKSFSGARQCSRERHAEPAPSRIRNTMQGPAHHVSPIKNWKQLVVVVVLAFVVPIAVIILLSQYVTDVSVPSDVDGARAEPDQAGRRGADRTRGRREERRSSAARAGARAQAPAPAQRRPRPHRRRRGRDAAAALRRGEAGRQEDLRHDVHGVPRRRASPARRNSATRRRGRRASSSASTRFMRARSRARARCPPKGGNASLPDADVKAAVDYMVAAAK